MLRSTLEWQEILEVQLPNWRQRPINLDVLIFLLIHWSCPWAKSCRSQGPSPIALR